ncbi:MAG: hypothetical protein AAF546_08310, partial [Verrucomicrobiota bacterium]
VIAHGHSRVTHDLDIVLALDPENTRRAIDALTSLGFRPRIPVAAADFSDPEKRRIWIETKNLQVFSMISERLDGFVINIFAEEPFDFENEWHAAIQKSLPGLQSSYHFISKQTLRKMKEAAGRAIDLDDLKNLAD